MAQRKKDIKDVSINSKRRKEFEKLIKKRGFNSINHFATAAGIVTSNLYLNLRGNFQISLDRALQIANTLELPLDDVLDIFIKDEMKKNRKIAKASKLPVE